ncbi:hypothetical protein HN446_02265 [bacterium]|jgi:hypothetical protein|nr:hypothetical protein [bacterium]
MKKYLLSLLFVLSIGVYSFGASEPSMRLVRLASLNWMVEKRMVTFRSPRDEDFVGGASCRVICKHDSDFAHGKLTHFKGSDGEDCFWVDFGTKLLPEADGTMDLYSCVSLLEHGDEVYFYNVLLKK